MTLMKGSFSLNEDHLYDVSMSDLEVTLYSYFGFDRRNICIVRH